MTYLPDNAYWQTIACAVSFHLRPAAMADVSEKGIDLTLVDAQVCFMELNFLHSRLDKLQTNNDEQRRIEDRMATLFRQMVSASYSVLDQCHYYIYCQFQNEAKLSFNGAAYNIKTPVKQKLKRSGDEGQDSVYREQRNKFVNDQCKLLFGERDRDTEERRALRLFQENLLKLQAITEVDDSSPDEAPPKLVRAERFTHASEPETQESNFFNAEVDFVKLESVQDSSWSVTTTFNVLHHFRNFTTHRALINCRAEACYLNLETREVKNEGEQDDWPPPWIKLDKGAWISVPEISDLKQQKREAPPRFHQLPLLKVCGEILSFVKEQRSNLLQMANCLTEPITVEWTLWDGNFDFKRGNEKISSYNFYEDNGDCVRFRTWKVDN